MNGETPSDPGKSSARKTIRVFLCGDVMTGRGIDQIPPTPVRSSSKRRLAMMTAQYAGPKARAKHLSYDESVDEAAKAIDAEPVEVEAEVPAEENEPVEGTADDTKPPPPAFEE